MGPASLLYIPTSAGALNVGEPYLAMIMSDTQLLLSLPIIIVSFIAATIFTKWAVNQYRLGHIPTIGFSDPFLSWYSALRFLTSSLEILGEGYKKHKSSVYKIPVMDGWMVVAAGKQLIDDMRRAPDDTLGFLAASARLLEMKYTFGPEVAVNDRHADVIRAQLTRNTVSLFPDVYDEIVAAFNDIVPTQSDGGWVTFKTTTSLRKIICRASNRIFVGLPVCRDEDYVAVNIEFAMDVVIGSQIIKQFPTFIKSIVGAYLTKVPAQTRRVSKHLKSIIEERWRMMAEYGDNWQDRPNDLLQWHIDTAEGGENTVRMLARRVLSVNFAAIHTTSQALTQTLYYVAECPEYADVMRDELQHVLDADGWTKAAMGKLRKMDSFIKEAQRMDGLNALNLARWTLKPFTFSNGITVPANTLLIAAARGVHRDEEYYEDPDVFKPWRFANLREQEGQWTKHQFAATSTEFIDFGHGRHACPGRFFASSELKAILGHIILNYDVIFEDDTSYPPHRYISGNCIPADVNLLLRKRTT